MRDLTLNGRRLAPGLGVYVLERPGQKYGAWVKAYDARYARRTAELRGKGETARRIRTQHELDRVVSLVPEEKRQHHQITSAGTRGHHVTANPPGPRFRDLAIGERFEFDRTGIGPGSALAHGPWTKTGARTYRHVDGGPSHRVGTWSVRVVRLNPPRARKGQRRRSTRKARRTRAGAGRYVAQEMRALKRGSKHVRTKRQAVAVGLARARKAGVRVPRAKSNPPLVVVNPPGKVRAVLGRPLEIRYRHEHDGKYYRHTFTGNDVIELLEGGAVRIRNRKGKSLWGDY